MLTAMYAHQWYEIYQTGAWRSEADIT